MPRKATVEEIYQKRFISVKDIVTLGLANSPKTVFNLISQGKFPVRSFRFGHKRVFKLEDVLAVLERNETPGASTN